MSVCSFCLSRQNLFWRPGKRSSLQTLTSAMTTTRTSWRGWSPSHHAASCGPQCGGHRWPRYLFIIVARFKLLMFRWNDKKICHAFQVLHLLSTNDECLEEPEKWNIPEDEVNDMDDCTLFSESCSLWCNRLYLFWCRCGFWVKFNWWNMIGLFMFFVWVLSFHELCAFKTLPWVVVQLRSSGNDKPIE